MTVRKDGKRMKYNHEIQFDLDHLSAYEDISNLDDKKVELDEVYSKAAKADEYEVKGAAFDEIKRIMDYNYPTKDDREGVRGYQHPKVALKDIGDVLDNYESREEK